MIFKKKSGNLNSWDKIIILHVILESPDLIYFFRILKIGFWE